MANSNQSLEGSIALITGGSGIVGAGIIKGFLTAGATVIAPVRNTEGKSTLLEELQDTNGANLTVLVVPGDYATAATMKNVVDAVTDHLVLSAETTDVEQQKLDHVVSCFGGSFPMGPASSLTPESVHQALNRALPHLLLSQSFFPLLKKGASSSFTFITGALGERCSMPGVAALTIANAAIYGMIRAIEAEQREQQQRQPQKINEIRIGALIRRDSQPGHPFIKEGRAYPASLIGDVAVRLAMTDQRGDDGIFRIFAADLEKQLDS